MMAHQESSQTGLISIIALIFAPASLIAVSEPGLKPTRKCFDATANPTFRAFSVLGSLRQTIALGLHISRRPYLLLSLSL